MLDKGIVPDAMLLLDVPDEVVVERISGRVLDPETGASYHLTFNPPPTEEIASRCITRSDDTAETVRTRLQNYHDNCDQVASALGSACELVEADGTRPIEQIAETFLGAVERCLLRNNCVAISMFSIASDLETRAQLFLPKGTTVPHPHSPTWHSLQSNPQPIAPQSSSASRTRTAWCCVCPSAARASPSPRASERWPRTRLCPRQHASCSPTSIRWRPRQPGSLSCTRCIETRSPS